MHKNDHVIHSGWMTKSPPDKKRKLGNWKIFKSKWTKRYFMLCKPASSLPSQYVLTYYTKIGGKAKGQIDLEQCHQIIESLKSDIHQYLFSIKTIHRGRERTYYLGTDTEEDMFTWVRCLCQVCGLKQEDSPDLPPANSRHRQITTTQKEKPSYIQIVQRGTPNGVAHHSPLQSPAVAVKEDEPAYLLMSDFQTGSRPLSTLDRQSSTSSVPEYLAPPPPCIDNSESLSNLTEDNEYMKPRPRAPVSDALTPAQSCPPTICRNRNTTSDGPPTAHLTVDANSCLATPRPHFTLNEDSYDKLPPPQPVRPPRPHHQLDVSLSTNVPTQRSRGPEVDHLDEYNVPKSNLPSDVLLSSCPPVCSGKVNAPDVESNHTAGLTKDLSYISMGQAPLVKDTSYLDMSGVRRSLPNDNVDGLFNTDEYVNPVPFIKATTPPERTDQSHRMSGTTPPSIPPRRGDVTVDSYSSVFSCDRTRSFKRNINSTLPAHFHDQPPVCLPPKSSKNTMDPTHSSGNQRNNLLIYSNLDVPDEKCEEDLVMFNIDAPMPPACLKTDGDLKYLDLDSQFEKGPSKTLPTMTQTTDYKEIDFVKTQALSDTKKIVDVQRKS